MVKEILAWLSANKEITIAAIGALLTGAGAICVAIIQGWFSRKPEDTPAPVNPSASVIPHAGTGDQPPC